MTKEAYYPEPQELDAYGNGGFRFGEFSHKGSLLILPSGIYGWPHRFFQDINPAAFDQLFAETPPPEFLILGTGQSQLFPNLLLQRAFIEAGIGLEVMDTGAAARTYNILFGEGRNVAAALLAVD